jgi:putative acetyltransferase
LTSPLQISLTIREDDLTDEAVAELLQSHWASATASSPEGSAHALKLDELRQPEITLWSAWHGEALAGCAALRELSKSHAEIKSMRTAPEFLRKGVAASLLHHIIAIASERGYQRLSLETGKNEAFAAARALYSRFGFSPCAPFGNYLDDGFSVCMTCEL